MLRRVDFWKEEREAPILRLNYSFLPSTKILERVDDDVEETSTRRLNYERIIRHDAERTFVGSAQQTTLMEVLSSLQNEFGSYHQAMSYVAGFLLLTHSPSKAIEIMRQLHRTVLIGYWTAEPVAFAVDAYVFDYLLAKHEPEIHKHLSKNYIFPETYAQKWFTTLCVGVLPFEALFLFFDTLVTQSLLESSNIFLFQFALSLMKHIREELLNSKKVADIYGYLRLDPSLPLFYPKANDLTISVVQHAKDYDLSQYDFALLRQQVFEEKLKARLEAANRAHKENKQNQDSIATSSDDDEDEEETLPSTMDNLVTHMKQLRIE
ncbi:unnamed protein product [Rotaria magnacalcarata]|uniref:Rab-GAP TBC domain-containing protein n=2 Tax=Rotaria magnacalcarata TaxID=392030 RepID=A0A819T0E7_9BILA|nr:unnamed protein product [Rotaria magnacalcarata]CAF2156649.1 unnamed protein product [Rotaria magnacalcarata]CAF3902819.1 unnamed protein product [Rotaria magnacalcarata]CAF4068574.1 unnamed protein product [Rotaria magnacalcarata]